ncbi:4-hydroxybenzoate octaprenyltransferase [bacterium]|nr:4-hydroxybenzoate octaprenyltransferase [bacterium]
MAKMFSTIRKWGSFVKISHTVFALPFALASMAVAARDTRGWPGWRVFLLVLGAMFCARTCAMAFNRIVDRKFDAMNPRTSGRHLPTGEISLPSAVTLNVVSAIGFIVCAWYLNPVCFYFSPVALFFTCFYSVTKRFTDYTHVFLGIALALAPIGAWLAVKGSDLTLLPLRESVLLPVLLAVGVVFWLVGFDLIYALQDYEFDRSNGLHSLVVAWGPKNALRAAFLSHLLMWGVLLAFGITARFRGVAYLVGMLVILVCLLMEHFIARKRSFGWINVAFFRLNAVISAVFLIVTLAEVVFFDFFRIKR